MNFTECSDSVACDSLRNNYFNFLKHSGDYWLYNFSPTLIRLSHWAFGWKIAENIKCYNLLFIPENLAFPCPWLMGCWLKNKWKCKLLNNWLQHFIGNGKVEMGISNFDFMLPRYMYFQVVAQILAAWVVRVKVFEL